MIVKGTQLQIFSLLITFPAEGYTITTLCPEMIQFMTITPLIVQTCPFGMWFLCKLTALLCRSLVDTVVITSFVIH
jgi:hypothetical protein